ncbi:MAG: hypothetical protein OCC46_14745 [Pseudodesulfovibrio sp.]
MKFIPHTIISIAALVMVFTFALMTPSHASGWNHMHEGNNAAMMPGSDGNSGPYHNTMMNGDTVGRGMMNGNMMQNGMMGQGMMNNGFMHNNNQAIQQCDYTFAPQSGAPSQPSR